MLVETDISTYRRYFPVDSNPFISERFIELNRDKVDRIIRLVDESGEPVIGLVAGIKDSTLRSPFSAPFGGFHFRKENVYISEIDRFLQLLSDYAAFRSLSRIEIITPPDLYHMTFNAKLINSLIRHGYYSALPDITNWVTWRCLMEFSARRTAGSISDRQNGIILYFQWLRMTEIAREYIN
jgi:hypothetical protein